MTQQLAKRNAIKKDEQSLSPLDHLLWAVIGLLLTISSVFIEVKIPLPQPVWPIDWSQVQTYPLGVTLQVGAILLVGCMAGRNTAALSQIAYLALGLSGLQIFGQGGGLGYFREPSFGYLLGFLPGAWLCGQVAFQQQRRLENLIRSCLLGLMAIHTVGLVYLSILSIPKGSLMAWWNAVLHYSIFPLPGQFIIVCIVAALAYLLRVALFY